jgi:hypothetical protein
MVVAQQPRLCPPAHHRRAGLGDRAADRRRPGGDPACARLSAAYRRFAEDEARGKSPLYEELARGVAADDEILDLLLSLPRPKRQPNLLFSAARHLLGTPDGWSRFQRGVAQRKDALCALMLMRSTQTNEPGRCAALLPILAGLPQPLALLEVGASRPLPPPRFLRLRLWRTLVGPETSVPEPPIFPCSVSPATPIPQTLPRIVWRAGIDLNPVDVSDPNQVAWLEALVWPEQTDRLARLRAAIGIAAANRPRLVEGDLRRDVARLAGEMPRDTTRVIFHTAVLAYVTSPDERAEFAGAAASLCDVWISNEAPRVFPEIAARAGSPVRPGNSCWR